MLYGLNKIANAIIKGVPADPSYFFACENFEMFLEKLYASKSRKNIRSTNNNRLSDNRRFN